MTVNVTYAPLSYVGNGSTSFALTWPFFAAAELRVTLEPTDGSSAPVAQTLGVHYSVAGGADANGTPSVGTLTMVTAPATGTQTLKIARQTVALQAVTWDAYSAFPEKSVEHGFDRRALVEQELANRIATAESTLTANAEAVESAAAAAISADAASADAAAADASAAAAAASEAVTAGLAAQVMANVAASAGIASDTTRLLDDISASFNGVLTTFPLTIGAAPVTPLAAAQLIVHLNGSYQVPGAGYTLSTSNIVFTAAPLTGSSCALIEIYSPADMVDVAFAASRANHTGTQAPATIAFAATAKLLGRATAGAGTGEEITLGTGLSLTGTTLNASGGVTLGNTSPWTAEQKFDAGVSIGSTTVTNRLLKSSNTTGGVSQTVGLTEDASGNVGIGTTAPTALLSVAGSALFGSNVFIGDSQRGYWIDNLSSFTYGITKSAPGSSARLDFYANAAARMSINSSGNVGIGTTAPAKTLDVVGTAGISGALSCGALTATSTATGDVPATSGTTDAQVAVRVLCSSVAFDTGVTPAGVIWKQARLASNFATNFPIALNPNGGGVAVGHMTPTATLDNAGDTYRQRTSRTPASAVAAGNAGDQCWDANYLYICIATNTWRRIAHNTW